MRFARRLSTTRRRRITLIALTQHLRPTDAQTRDALSYQRAFWNSAIRPSVCPMAQLPKLYARWLPAA